MPLSAAKFMTSLPAESIPKEAEITMKELAEHYRPLKQRTVRSETTKDKAGDLPPAAWILKTRFQILDSIMFQGRFYLITMRGREIRSNCPPSQQSIENQLHSFKLHIGLGLFSRELKVVKEQLGLLPKISELTHCLILSSELKKELEECKMRPSQESKPLTKKEKEYKVISKRNKTR
ncbi:hypothetical protein P5673_025692 [Acropora cervicornis]|uniref:Uncharacterized protein n=1 Tax=Acropora cervicornis TaxID=6130 RepID=A0AAD9UX97_ACRCE|nr:hypothetical protein P5673_025692 [Acropora cervicornis]